MRTIQTFNFESKKSGAAAIRIRYDKTVSEYRVELVQIDNNNKKFVNEDYTYFTDDKQDAQDTAQHIFNEMEC